MTWGLASLIIQVIQMGFYLSSVDKYKDKLEDLASFLSSSADADQAEYRRFRDKDPEFYDYYKNLPDYEMCDSAVKRAKGESFYKYGAQLRRRTRTTRGYTPLANVYWNTVHANDALAETALSRGVSYIRERKRRDNHILERWSAIVSAPVAVERYQAATVSRITDSSFRSLKAYARGFNSAGSAFGTTLFRILN